MVIELNQICHFPKKHLVQITDYFHYIYNFSSYWISLEVAAAEGCGWQLLWCFLRLKPHQSCSSQSEISNNQPQSHASQPSKCIGTFKYVFQSASIPISEHQSSHTSTTKASNTPVILFKELFLTLDCWWCCLSSWAQATMADLVLTMCIVLTVLAPVLRRHIN